MYEVYINAVRGNSLFKGIKDNDLLSLLECTRPEVISFQKGETVIMSGEKLKGIGIVVSGGVDVIKETAGGDRYIFAKLGRGAVFAEAAAFLNPSIAPVTVASAGKSEIMFLPAERVIFSCEKSCNFHSIMIRNILEILSNKAMLLNKKIEYLTIKSMRGRISAYLLNIYNKSKKTSFKIPYSKSDLADYLGVTRPSMSRELGRMRDEGIINFNGRDFEIIDLNRLAGSVKY
ncbi:MAG: Fumarate and nitrate reduction regulatory protein [Firmicutes bacterium ADurb.Bin193]|nr:MAG: Fumarate and nitrate reduction regulatory protein [Firmicutes bacterium ADurb.Bin193]